MKTSTAFLLRFLLPPLYAALGFAIAALAGSPDAIAEIVVLFGVFALYAYVFAGPPALLFAFVMARLEKRFGSGRSLLLAPLLGGLSGTAIGAVFGDINAFVLFIPIGLAVGFLVEVTVLLLKRRVLRTTDSRPAP